MKKDIITRVVIQGEVKLEQDKKVSRRREKKCFRRKSRRHLPYTTLMTMTISLNIFYIFLHIKYSYVCVFIYSYVIEPKEILTHV